MQPKLETCVGGDTGEYRGFFDVFVTLDRSASCFKIDRKASHFCWSENWLDVTLVVIVHHHHNLPHSSRLFTTNN
jgi:hypothetical protein